MSVTRIAEAIQTTAWMRYAGAISVRIQTEQPDRTNWVKSSAGAVDLALNLIVFTSFVLSFWRLGQDLDWSGNFFIERGFFSHWQVWLALAISLKFLQGRLQRVVSVPQPAKAPVVRH